MITTKQLHRLFNLLENDSSVNKPYKVFVVKESGDALDVITDKHNLRVFLEEEFIAEL